MNLSLARATKAIVGLIVMLILFSVVSRWWGEYRETVRASGKETTTTAPRAGESEGSKEATKGAGGKAPSTKPRTQVVVLTDGLNFRDQPSRDEGNKIRGLKKGERLTLIKTQGGWHQVEDSSGTRGWISSSSSYSKILK